MQLTAGISGRIWKLYSAQHCGILVGTLMILQSNFFFFFFQAMKQWWQLKVENFDTTLFFKVCLLMTRNGIQKQVRVSLTTVFNRHEFKQAKDYKMERAQMPIHGLSR